jgi:hypothetical protein
MVYFTLIASGGDPSCVHNCMPKNVESLQESKTSKSIKLPKGKNVIGCKLVYRNIELAMKAFLLTELVEKRGVMSKLGLMILSLSGTCGF